MNHTVLNMYALIHSNNCWTLPSHPSDVDLSFVRCHNVSGVRNLEVRRGCMSSSGLMETIGTTIIFYVYVFLGTLVNPSGSVYRDILRMHTLVTSLSMRSRHLGWISTVAGNFSSQMSHVNARTFPLYGVSLVKEGLDYCKSHSTRMCVSGLLVQSTIGGFSSSGSVGIQYRRAC